MKQLLSSLFDDVDVFHGFFSLADFMYNVRRHGPSRSHVYELAQLRISFTKWTKLLSLTTGIFAVNTFLQAFLKRSKDRKSE